MRTSVLDIIRLAIALINNPSREHLRLGQLISNARATAGRHGDRATLFFVENRELVKSIWRYL